MLQIHARQLRNVYYQSNNGQALLLSAGGLVPAALLARELGIRHVDTVCI